MLKAKATWFEIDPDGERNVLATQVIEAETNEELEQMAADLGTGLPPMTTLTKRELRIDYIGCVGGLGQKATRAAIEAEPDDPGRV